MLFFSLQKNGLESGLLFPGLRLYEIPFQNLQLACGPSSFAARVSKRGRGNISPFFFFPLRKHESFPPLFPSAKVMIPWAQRSSLFPFFSPPPFFFHGFNTFFPLFFFFSGFSAS